MVVLHLMQAWPVVGWALHLATALHSFCSRRRPCAGSALLMFSFVRRAAVEQAYQQSKDTPGLLLSPGLHTDNLDLTAARIRAARESWSLTETVERAVLMEGPQHTLRAIRWQRILGDVPPRSQPTIIPGARRRLAAAIPAAAR